MATKKKSAWGGGYTNSIQQSAARALSPAPSSPDPSEYDPALDAQGRASDRGYAQLLDDLATQGRRALDQYGTDKGQVTQTRDWSLADLSNALAREGQDYTTSTGRLSQDHTTNLDSIGRNYQRLGVSQAGAASQHGITSAGAFAAAKAARDANQGLDTTAENQSFDRSSQDLLTNHLRYGADNQTQVGRLGTTSQQQLDALGSQYDNGVADRTVAGSRAGSENTFFQQDVGAQKWYQAGQNGYVAPLAAHPVNKLQPNPLTTALNALSKKKKR